MKSMLSCVVPMLALLAVPAFADTTIETVPADGEQYVACTADGLGEFVAVTGSYHIVTSLTFDGAGGIHYKSVINSQGISGVGETTGLKYQFSGTTKNSTEGSLSGYPMVQTFMHTERVISQGGAPNFHLRVFGHTTINANGTVTSSIDRTESVCK